ncbi:MAG: SMC-Scp complex subunit ScpB [Patescibacteria group bacterium]
MEQEKQNNPSAIIEALLFVYGEPMEIKRIKKILNVSEETVREAANILKEEYAAEKRGLILIENADRLQLATKPEISVFLEDFVKEEFKEELTPASLESLSLIAYLGPLSRARLDYFRGVNSSFILRNLLLRGLIERYPDPQKGNVYLYQASFDLLKYLGISKIEDLPEYHKYKELINQENKTKD